MTSRRLPTNARFIHELPPTPLVPVRLESGDPEIWCKLEFLNPSGSTKDRIARYILEKAWRRGRIGPGAEVVEASSGSTAIALALACAQLGLRFTAVMPEGASRERRLMLLALGARLVLTPREEEMSGAVRRAEELARQTGAFPTRQFDNPDNPEAHKLWTGQEILAQIPGGTVDAVVSGVGTGGTLVGLYQAFSEAACDPVPVVARPIHREGSPLSGNIECSSFSHRIPGVVEGLSCLYRDAALPGRIEIEIQDDEAYSTARRLIARGFPVGPSSGLNYAAAVSAARTLGGRARIVTVFPDRMERYFSTELFAPFKKRV